jgi:multidrug efflux system membrane fusion protein
VGAIILLLILITYLTHRHSAAEAGAGRGGRGGAGGPTVISTTTAQTGTIGVYVNALGTVTPVYTVSVEARVAGQITRVNYTEGQHVQVGDSLIEIDPRPYEAAVLQAKGQLAHDAALLEDAKLDLDRYRQAFESNAIPKQQYDTQLATVHQDEGSVQLDQGNLDNANVNLAYSSITSPIDGRVGLRLVDPGNLVQANGTTPLAVITRPNRSLSFSQSPKISFPKYFPQCIGTQTCPWKFTTVKTRLKSPRANWKPSTIKLIRPPARSSSGVFAPIKTNPFSRINSSMFGSW